MTPIALEELVKGFVAGTLPRESWTHAAHVAVGAWHVDRLGRDGALEELRRGIRALNERLGGRNTDTSGYHETITAAYVELIALFFARCPPELALAARVRELVGGPLGSSAVLLRFWSKERLMSPEARRAWLPPDLGPLEWPD